MEDIEVEAIKALTEFLSAVESANFTEIIGRARIAKEVWAKLGMMKLDEKAKAVAASAPVNANAAAKEEGWRVITAVKPVSKEDKALQWLAKKMGKYNLEWMWVTGDSGEIIGIKYRTVAPMYDVESAARWAFRAAAERPSASQPTDGKNGGGKSGGAGKGALAFERPIK